MGLHISTAHKPLHTAHKPLCGTQRTLAGCSCRQRCTHKHSVNMAHGLCHSKHIAKSSITLSTVLAQGPYTPHPAKPAPSQAYTQSGTQSCPRVTSQSRAPSGAAGPSQGSAAHCPCGCQRHAAHAQAPHQHSACSGRSNGRDRDRTKKQQGEVQRGALAMLTQSSQQLTGGVAAMVAVHASTCCALDRPQRTHQATPSPKTQQSRRFPPSLPQARRQMSTHP